jgi:cytochrome P450
MAAAEQTSSSPARIPGPGRWIPLEELQAFREAPLGALVQIARRYGDIVQYPVGFWTIYLLNHPDYVKHVLQDNHRNYGKATFQYQMLGMVTGQGLLTSDGSFWLRQRRLVQPAFHRERIAGLATVITGATERMVGRWVGLARQGQVVDLDAEMMRLTLEIVGQALFSQDLSGEASRLAQAVLATLDYVIYRAQTPIALPASIPTPRNRRFRAALQTLDEAVYALIAARRPAPGDHGDLLSMLLQARDEESGAVMDERQIRDEIITLMIAGHETAASVLTWAWYLLACHPEVEQAVLTEARDVLAGRLPGAHDALPMTRMVLEESMRLYPPAWVMTRRALAADEIGGYPIPAGALVFLSPYLTQRHPAWWTEPERFQPNRFGPEQVASRPRFAYFPFGGGPRLCIGQAFAMLETQLVLASVITRYRVTLATEEPVVVEPGVTLRPRGGLAVRLEIR